MLFGGFCFLFAFFVNAFWIFCCSLWYPWLSSSLMRLHFPADTRVRETRYNQLLCKVKFACCIWAALKCWSIDRPIGKAVCQNIWSIANKLPTSSGYEPAELCVPWDFSLCLDLHSQFSRGEQHRTLVNTGDVGVLGPALGVKTSGGTRSLWKVI